MSEVVAQEPPDEPASDWVREGPFRKAVGSATVIELLTDPRLEANFLQMLVGSGLPSGPERDLAAAALLSMNGEVHQRYRSLVAQQFTPRAVERSRPMARAAAQTLADELAPAGRAELVARFANPFVAAVTCRHIGFEVADIEAVWPAIAALAHASKDLKGRLEEFTRSGMELVDAGRKAVGARAGDERDGDVLGALANHIAAGEMPEEVAFSLLAAILSAGHEPTINQLAIAVELLARHPEVWDGLGTGRLAPAPVVEELLRFRSTNVAATRHVAAPCAHDGQVLLRGEVIVVGLDEANHDERRFEDPFTFDVDRERTSHLAFGFGPHHCLGAALARMQLQEGLVALASRFTDLVVEDVVEPVSGGLRGPTGLTMSFRRRS